ncbi:pyridoxal 5'-phosphate synthase glutaminase subunit PdxT [uncultured Dialister sp.]|uniref:pyridoxal 5'-phosphate synthase glutaminase subunit PdxT n=1 Tax=uncultured Dialister sp. TaxID=278064 RepID=UPI0025D41028|nr:pyridoxal 5'-phosphate synthase glutaminase subunit PdxT [uncultured Dialister sp.]
MKIGILALQGAFIEHEKMIASLGEEPLEIRNAKDLVPLDGLILPGGESTTMRKLLREEKLYEPLKREIEEGLPVLATCAGMILLARHLSNDDDPCFGTLPVTVERNAYGRQLGSFITTAEVKGIGPFRMNFIRAPYVTAADPLVEILSKVEGRIVAVRYKNQTALAFHPELGTDTRIHEKFLEQCRKWKKK